MEKFRNKYRIQSTRLQNWDYGSNGAYFITICTKNREHFFGKIVNGQLITSELGEIAALFWKEIPKHFPYIILDAFVVMPNHIHGVLVIDKDPSYCDTMDVCKDAIYRVTSNTNQNTGNNTDAINRVSTAGISTGGATGNHNPMFHQNISRIIRWYKGRCSFEMRKINPGFNWQSLFHDHIIRNVKSHTNIQNYIINNPLNWKEDKFHK